MDLDLQERTALVTGSTRGIGFATAVGLARMGARVVLHGRTDDSVAKGLQRFQEAAGSAGEGVAGDLGDAGGCSRVIAAVPEADILVNNMGIYEMRPFDEIDDATWLDYFQINVMSGVRMARHYLPAMRRKDWGRVVFVSSESGVFIPPEMIHYGFTKAAQLAIGRGLAETTAGTGVTVNSVLPGPTWVETQEERLGERAKDENRTIEDVQGDTFRLRRTSSLLRRYATVDEVANMICYVCSKASSATNGASLRVDGGVVRTYI